MATAPQSNMYTDSLLPMQKFLASQLSLKHGNAAIVQQSESFHDQQFTKLPKTTNDNDLNCDSTASVAQSKDGRMQCASHGFRRRLNRHKTLSPPRYFAQSHAQLETPRTSSRPFECILVFISPDTHRTLSWYNLSLNPE
ncbi:hypothetical protein TRVL_05834 [Trypanosoma vivax]|nr:hypothetical protein TRVL_05834 [Trypanosoma vivax]